MPALVGPTAGRIWARNGLTLVPSAGVSLWNAVPVHSCAASHWITIIFPLFDAGDMLRITLLISSSVVLLIWRTVEKSLRHKMDVHTQTDTERQSSYLFVIAMALRIGGV